MNGAKITYKLLDNGTGVILTRNPVTTKSKLTVCFEGAPAGAYAAFCFDNGREMYREVVDNECSIIMVSREGEIKVGIMTLNDDSHAHRWNCEALKYNTSESGDIYITPNDMNLPDVVTELKLENEELRHNFAELLTKFDRLEQKVNHIMEGYDIT